MSSMMKDPFKTSVDPFEMGDFSINATNYVDAIGLLDKKILEMKVCIQIFYNFIFTSRYYNGTTYYSL